MHTRQQSVCTHVWWWLGDCVAGLRVDGLIALWFGACSLVAVPCDGSSLQDMCVQVLFRRSLGLPYLPHVTGRESSSVVAVNSMTAVTSPPCACAVTAGDWLLVVAGKNRSSKASLTKFTPNCRPLTRSQVCVARDAARRCSSLSCVRVRIRGRLLHISRRKARRPSVKTARCSGQAQRTWVWLLLFDPLRVPPRAVCPPLYTVAGQSCPDARVRGRLEGRAEVGCV
jgi:hypothetical protein